ncbi:MAG: catalase HPII, partial [Nitrosospira sp.]
MKTNDEKDRDNRSTIGSPAREEGTPANDFTAKLAAAQELAAAMPYNVNKAFEHGDVSASPEKGQTVEVSDPIVTGSTLTETIASEKVGAGEPLLGFNPGNESLDRVRVDSSDQVLTTNQGVAVGD